MKNLKKFLNFSLWKKSVSKLFFFKRIEKFKNFSIQLLKMIVKYLKNEQIKK